MLLALCITLLSYTMSPEPVIDTICQGPGCQNSSGSPIAGFVLQVDHPCPAPIPTCHAWLGQTTGCPVQDDSHCALLGSILCSPTSEWLLYNACDTWSQTEPGACLIWPGVMTGEILFVSWED